MPTIERPFILCALAAAIFVALACVAQYDSGPWMLAVFGSISVGLSIAGLYRSLAPQLQKQAATLAAQKDQIATLQSQLATFNYRVQSQVAHHATAVEAEKKAAIENSSAKSRFLAQMGHEIRTPLTGLISMANLLNQTRLTDHQRRLTGTLDRSAQMLLTVVNNMLDVAALEDGVSRIEAKPFDVSRCVEDAAESLLAAAREKNLDMSVFVTSDMPQTLIGDKSRLRQILMNLIGNAIKFTDTGTIEVSAMLSGRTPAGSNIRFVVRDSGPGMSAAQQARILNSITKPDTVLAPAAGGGMGLSIVNAAVKLMGGTMKIDSTPSHGTAVEVVIPFDAVEAASTEKDRPLVGIRILVAGAREVQRQILGSYLSAFGGEIEAAETAWEALDLMRGAIEKEEPYALVVADADLPCEWEGDFASTMRADVPVTETGLILVCTDHARFDALAARSQEQWACIGTPILRKDLLEAVAMQLAHLELPEPDSEQDKAAPASSGQPLSKIRVLVAEDNPINQEVMREHLSEFGCTFDIEPNGEAALKAFRNAKYDIVLMDCQMPVMDGLSATEAMREHERSTKAKHTPIVAVSAHAYERERVRCLGAQMDDFLSKPYTQLQLRYIMEKTLFPKAPAKVA